jgi:predicted DNA-binding ribbon-helix-helix protein
LVRKKRGRGIVPDAPRLPLVSIELDPVSWEALKDIATQQNRSVDELVTEIARDSLSLAIRFYIVEWYRSEPE